MVTQITSVDDFKKAVEGGNIVVVDFFATWCAPCINFAPQFDNISKEYPSLTFLKVDVDQLPELQTKYSITSIPAFKIFKEGNVVAEVVGANAANLKSAIDKYV